MDSYASVINTRAEQVISAAVNDEVGVYRWIKSLVAETVKDYRGRFLHELIQNGYDAHPSGSSDGKIAVHLREDEGEHGVLYVANGGNPLTESNFTRMASLGDSDKAIGVGIGNKGVGFKSVFQICDAPEVYSAETASAPGFSGFSFRFGRWSDLDAFLSADDPAREKIREELSLSLLTVPLSQPPATVAAFREEGFVTVLRLPLVSEVATHEVRTRIESLIKSQSPILLFLDRIAEMTLCGSASELATVLTRSQCDVDGETRVVLNGADHYLCYDAAVSSADLQAALGEAVDAGVLDERWLAWTSEARVSVAVGDGWEVESPSAFTYLPMGDGARSPLGGHINAPFITDFARLGLDSANPVNALLLREIAKVCLAAGSDLCEGRQRPNTVVDLLAWNAEASGLARGVAGATSDENPLRDAIHLPVFGRSEWSPLAALWIWPSVQCKVVTRAEVTAQCGAPLLDTDAITPGRVKRLRHVLSDATALEPPEETVAGWTEDVAMAILRRDDGAESWRAFYDDLAELFSSGEALYGRRILLVEDRTLVAADDPRPVPKKARGRAERQRRSVFFAPRTTGTDDDDAVDSDEALSPPRALARQIVFTSRELQWYDGAQQTRGRKFLQDHRLARQFRTASLLGHLGQLMAGHPTDALKRAALEFAFRLFAASPERHATELAAVGLFVPSARGSWVRADVAHFSRGWTVPGSGDLTMLVEGAPSASSEFAQMGERLLAEPSALASGADSISRWQTFLEVLGVSGTLPLMSCADGRRIQGRRLNAMVLAGDFAPSGVPSRVREQWAEGIKVDGNGSHPETAFFTSDVLFWLTGQGEIEAMPVQHRRAFARLVILTLPSLTQEHKWSIWRREVPRGVSTSVETPLWAFVSRQPWMAVQLPMGGGVSFAPPTQAWYVGPEDMMAASYSPLVEPVIRKLLLANENGRSLLKQLGMLDWSDPRHSARLINHLGSVFRDGEIPETAAEHMRASMARAWGAIGEGGLIESPAIEEGLILQKSGRLVHTGTAGDYVPPIFISSVNDQSATARLVRELGWAVLLVGSDQPLALQIVGEMIRGVWPGEVHVTSDWDMDVIVDGAPWQASVDAPRLVDTVPWLPLLFALCMRFPRASGIRIGRQLSGVLDVLNRICLVRANDVRVSSADAAQPLPPRLKGVLPVAGDVPTLVTEGLFEPLSWTDLESVAQGVLELVGQERFKAEVSLVIRDLSTDRGQLIDKPYPGEYAAILGVTDEQIHEVEVEVSGILHEVVERLRIVGPAIWGPSCIAGLDQFSSSTSTREDLLLLIIDQGTTADRAQMILSEAVRSESPDQLRIALGVSLASYNASLREHFPHIPQVDRTAQHSEGFQYRVRQRKSELFDVVRAARVDRFLRGELQGDWPNVSQLQFLTPDPEWGTSLDSLTVELVDERIDEQLESELGPAAANGKALPAIDEVRRLNGSNLRSLISAARPVVTVWCEQNIEQRPPAWDTEEFDSELWLLLAGGGALDFFPLSEAHAGEWLHRVGAWPENMSKTLDVNAHGLASAALSAQSAAEAEERARRAHATRQIHYQGGAVEVDSSLRELVARVSQFLETKPRSLNTPYRTSGMDDISGGAKSLRARGGGASFQSSVPARLSSAQSSAIGVVGELIAFDWLVSRDPSGLVDVSCWKSTNVRFAAEGAAGDDGLGFDFEVPRREGTVMYEVKATSGAAGMIELGESEVRCAQTHARTDRWRLLIVEDALSQTPRVHMLPNPFHSKSRSFFRFVGNSVRLRFTLDD